MAEFPALHGPDAGRSRHPSRKTGVAIEFNIPQTGEKIDIILTGIIQDRQRTSVIVEVKQWQKDSGRNPPGRKRNSYMTAALVGVPGASLRRGHLYGGRIPVRQEH